MTDYPYTWRVKTRLPERKGSPCRVLARGRMNSALVEFTDGYRVVTSRNYLRKTMKTKHIHYECKCGSSAVMLIPEHEAPGPKTCGYCGQEMTLKEPPKSQK
jgi:predicted SprT family Zn-dependent metalloprotease